DPHARFADMSAAAAALGELTGARAVATLADSPRARRPTTRRRYVRAPYMSLARLELAGGAFLNARVEEISEGGCQVLADRALSSGERVKLKFATPISGRIVEVPADCRWTRSTRVAMAHGFEFASLAPDVTTEIRKYVALMGNAYGPERPSEAPPLQAVR
ncbi:MAG TPA: PilZ domain-containing protein, partial [Polyangiaceae bacterium]